MLNISVISSGTEYSLSDNADYILLGIDGISSAPVARLTEQGAMQHGSSDLGFRLQSRRIAISLLARGGSEDDWLSRRTALMRIFRSSNDPVSLRIAGGTIVRQIDAHLNGTMEMTPESGTMPGWQRVGIELYCPDPTWYDPEGSSAQFGLGGGGSVMNVPLAVPVNVGASVIDQSVVIDYPGTWDAYPIIYAVGPLKNLLIQNNTLGDKLSFDGITIPSGDTYIIDCRYGYKTVTRISDGANRIQDLTSDSNLATFRIGAHPDVQDGVNSIRVAAQDLTASSRLVIRYNVRYIGV